MLEGRDKRHSRPPTNLATDRNGVPHDFDDRDGYYAAAYAFGQALDIVQTWWPRRVELAWELRERGLSINHIGRLLRCNARTVRRMLEQQRALAAEYDRACEVGDALIVL